MRELAARLSNQPLGLIALAILTAFVLAPAFLVDIPAMYDYPNHVARLHIIVAEQTGNPHPFYETVWSLIPNLAFDLLVPPLARFVSVETATKALFLISEVSIVTGAVALEYVVKGRHQIAGFVALIILYSTPFMAGLLNFELGMGVALWGMAVWIGLRDNAWSLRFAVHTAFVAGLSVFHLGALALYGATIGLYEASRIWRRGRFDRRDLDIIILLSAPAIISLLIMKLGSGSIGSGESVWNFRWKLIWIIGSLNGYSVVASVVGTFVLSAILLELRRRRAIELLEPGKWIGLGLFALFTISPVTLLGSFFADARVLTGLMLVMPAFIAISRTKRELHIVVAVILSGMAITSTLITAGVWGAFGRDQANLHSSFQFIPPKSLVLVGEDDTTFRVWTSGPPFGHAPTLAVYYAQALVPSFYAIPGSQPVRLRDHVQRFAIENPRNYSPVPLSVLTASVARGENVREHVVDHWSKEFQLVSRWSKEFEFLYLLGQPARNPFPDLLVEIFKGEHFILYRIRRQSDAPPG